MNALVQPIDIVKDIQNIDVLTQKMLQQEQADCPVIHRFSPGIYIREVFMPKGIMVVGHYHKQAHLNVFLKGTLSLFNDQGRIKTLTAPMMFTTEKGRKCAYIHEDVTWMNVYPMEETDVETIESIIFEDNETFEAEKVKRQQVKRFEDVHDYHQVLKEFDFTEQFVRQASENTDDQIPMPSGSYKFMAKDSTIEGRGIHATARIEPDEIIGPVLIDKKRTPLGRFTNHAKHPNAKMMQIKNNIYLVATKSISGNQGGFAGEEITVDYRETIRLSMEIF